VNKRSATFIAATLVGVLAIGGTAFSLGLTGPSESNATEGPTTDGQSPTVATETRTVIGHRQAALPTPSAVPDPSPSSGPSASSGPGHEGSHDDHEGEDHGGHEGEDDHGDHDGHEGEDDQGGDDD
jgi:hypothetical protein